MEDRKEKSRAKGSKSRAKRGGGKFVASAGDITSHDDLAVRNILEKGIHGDGEDEVSEGSGSDENSDLGFDFEKASVGAKETGEEDGDDKYEDVFRISTEVPVFEKEKSLNIRDLIQQSSLEEETAEVDFKEEQGEGVKDPEKQVESETDELVGQQSADDLERLDEIRMERERARQRREYEQKKKEDLKKLAAQRAEELAKKAGNKGKKKGGKRK